MSEVEILFNGESRKVKSSTIAELLEEFSLSGKKLAVELNRNVVARSNFASTAISAGDSIEVVQFVGGG